MNENLAKMLKEDIPESAEEQEEDVEVINEDAPENQRTILEIKPFSDWFERYHSNFDNINQVKVAIRGVDSNKTIIITIPDPKNEKDENGNLKRRVKIFEDSDQIPVIDLEPVSMDIYNNGFRIVYTPDSDVAIKCYGVKTGLIATICNIIDGQMIPYQIMKVKKKESNVEIVKDTNDVRSKLLQPADKENIQILYKQITKFISDINTQQDAVNWFLTRQSEVMDVNHHLQIDEVICYILK